MNNVIHMLHGMTADQKIELFEKRLNALISKEDNKLAMIVKKNLTSLKTSLCEKANGFEKPESQHIFLISTSFVLNFLSKYKRISDLDAEKIFDGLYGEILDSVILITEYTSKYNISSKGFSLDDDNEGKVITIAFIYDLNEEHDLVFSINVN